MNVSSFCAYGAFFNDFFDMLKDEFTEKEYDDFESEIIDIIEDKFKCKVVFSFANQEGCYGTYFGRSYRGIKDDETGEQFKDKTKQIMEYLFKDISELSFSYIEKIIEL